MAKARIPKVSAAWRNRIVGTGEEAPDQLLANPKNWRTHPVNQREALRGALDQVGWVQQVMVNRVTGHIVDGHARVEEALTRGEASVPVLYVELEPHEEDVVLATLDPIGALATRDDERLRMLLAEVEFDAEALREMTEALMDVGDLGDHSLVEYTAKVDVPQYQVVGERPEPSALYDETRTIELRSAVKTADVPEDVRAFLLAAAARHTVFNYRLIAEFYPHAAPELQRLMEDSALVIIDFDDALRLGYAKLTHSLDKLLDDQDDDA